MTKDITYIYVCMHTLWGSQAAMHMECCCGIVNPTHSARGVGIINCNSKTKMIVAMWLTVLISHNSTTQVY